MRKFVVAGGSALLVAVALVVVWWWLDQRRRPRDQRPGFLSVGVLVPVGVLVVVTQVLVEVVGRLADRLDRIDLAGTTAGARRDTLVCVVAAGAVGAIFDLADAWSRERSAASRIHRGLGRVGLRFLALVGTGLLVAPAVDGVDGWDARLEFAGLLWAVATVIEAAEQRRPSRGIALAVGAAVFAAVLTERSPQLTGLSITVASAVVVAVPVLKGWAPLGTSGAGALGAAIAAATALSGGGSALDLASTVAAFCGIGAMLVMIRSRGVPRQVGSAG